VNGIIRKISIGSDYKSGAMHYVVGQKVLGGSHSVHLISKVNNGYQIWVEKGKEIVLWKEVSSEMPVSVEYDVNFE